MCRKVSQEDASGDFLLCLSLVGVRGFEPPTTSTPLKCATGLRYTPSVLLWVSLAGDIYCLEHHAL